MRPWLRSTMVMRWEFSSLMFTQVAQAGIVRLVCAVLAAAIAADEGAR